MRRYGKLWDKIVSRENILKAFERAAKGKKWRHGIKKALANKEVLTDKLIDSLQNGTYHTSPYRTKQIYEPKERTIYILPFYPDRVLHHAIMAVLEPIWDGMMFYHSYACRENKGQYAGSKQCMKWTVGYDYCLKCDISKFYPSVNHDVLKTIIEKKIKDVKLLNLLHDIIDSAEGKTNIPIGNYLSQWFGNLYLNELDHFIKDTLRVRAYMRYCDDFVLFSNDKRQLATWRDAIVEYASNVLKMSLSKKSIFRTTQGVDYLGYRHFQKGYILLRKRTAARLKKRMRHLSIQRNGLKYSRGQVASSFGLIRHCNGHNLAIATNIQALAEAVGCKI